MPIQSPWTVPIPTASLPTFMFGSTHDPLPPRVAFVDTTNPEAHQLSAQAFRLWSKRIAVGLAQAGFQPGDRLLLFSANSIFFPAVFMGVIMAGGIFTAASPSYVARELAHQLRDADAVLLLAPKSRLDIAREAAQMASMRPSQIFLFDDAPLLGPGEDVHGIRHWEALIGSVADGEKYAWREPASTDETICLNYSSGTTGLPKGVEVSHYNYVANTVQFNHRFAQHPDEATRLQTARTLAVIPMYHAFGQSTFIVSSFARGVPVYLMPQFDLLHTLDSIQRHRITELSVVPPIIIAIAKHPASKKYDLSSLNLVSSGAAPLGRKQCEELEALFPPGQINVKQGWGMTEVTCALIMWSPKDVCTSTSVGQLNANCSAKIMNDEGTAELPPGALGELWVRGPSIMKGYWRNPAATADTLTADGWLKTGDVGFHDANHTFHVVDRRKELIKVRGLQVAPAELEAVLLEHPDVADAAVIGVTRDGAELPRAYVVRRPGRAPSADGLAYWFQRRVARYKRLQGGVEFVTAIPKNPSGKILRKLLREKAQQEVQSGEQSGDVKAKL